MPSAAKRSERAPLLALSLDPEQATPLHRQIYEQIRGAVLSGRLTAGARLPSSRILARELGCSRNTITNAFELLLAEGYLEGQTGSGTYVSRVLPEELLTARKSRAGRIDGGAVGLDTLSKRGRALSEIYRKEPGWLLEHRRGSRGGLSRAFTPNRPEVGQFPFEIFARLLSRTWRNPPDQLVRRGPVAGHPPLRRAIAGYLRALRALDCSEEQVFITSGTQHGLDLIARILLDPGDRVWIEEPGYTGLRGPLIAAAADLVPVPVDAEGLSVEAGRQRAADAQMVVVTPSHQYPLGITMSLTRRLELLAWARDHGVWVVEDDYDSEFRYDGRPLAALQGLDEAGRVLYLGTFTKTLFPTLRVGYLVVPPGLVEPLTRARAAIEDQPAAAVQPALAAFIEDGHFAAHVRRMRKLYATRQEVLLDAAKADLAGLIRLTPDNAGMHLVGALEPDLAARLDDRAAAARIAEAGLTVPALSSYYLETVRREGLLFGYAGVPEPEIRSAVRQLAATLR